MKAQRHGGHAPGHGTCRQAIIRRYGGQGGHDRPTRVLLGVSALVLTVSMVLALSWALGEAAGLPRLPVNWMVATHSLLNAFGFALCAIGAWLRLRPEPL
ncbi:YndJ family transporter [Streptosporangium sp. NPDC087985]|uniref:YndJ family transporter n=1 Tax=Streptosporangium sp. NPDC087985 TaxID=3366196 RepID=UPI003815BAA2